MYCIILNPGESQPVPGVSHHRSIDPGGEIHLDALLLPAVTERRSADGSLAIRTRPFLLQPQTNAGIAVAMSALVTVQSDQRTNAAKANCLRYRVGLDLTANRTALMVTVSRQWSRARGPDEKVVKLDRARALNAGARGRPSCRDDPRGPKQVLHKRGPRQKLALKTSPLYRASRQRQSSTHSLRALLCAPNFGSEDIPVT
jgi:hypothetical protein